ncbi:MAG: response regulator [bacterium]
MPVRILVVDDHQIVREGFCALIDKQPDLEVVGQAGDGRTAIQRARELHPGVILMDITMPDMNGLEASRLIHEEYPGVKIIILSIHADREYVEKAIQTGIRGYLLKDCAFNELIIAIRTVLANRIYLSPAITDVVVENYFLRESGAAGEASEMDSLTSREREILQLIAEGHTSKEIADRLHVGISTVDSHRQRIMEKLDIHDVPHLVKYAIRKGLTSLNH